MSILPLKSREIIKRLERLGFIFDHQTGSHLIYHHPATKRRAVVPRHNDDLPKGTVRFIIRESGISLAEFLSDL